MKRSDAFPSNYLNKDAVKEKGSILATIDTVDNIEFEDEDTKKTKPVLYFSNGVKPFVCNLVNWMTLEDAFGEDSDAWKGCEIEIYFDPTVMYGPKRTGGTRIRVPQTAPVKPAPVKPSGNGTKPQAAPAPAPETPSALKAKRALKVTPGFDMEGFKANVAQQIPYYADKNGKPDSFHIIGALTKLSIDNLGPDNAEEAFAMLGFHAQAEQDAKQVEREAKQAA